MNFRWAAILADSHHCSPHCDFWKLVKRTGSSNSGVSEKTNAFLIFPREDIIIYLEISARTCLTTKQGWP